jgi:hypothetical protein
VPGLGDGASLEDDVLAIVLRQEEARGEACLARADHHRVDALHGYAGAKSSSLSRR